MAWTEKDREDCHVKVQQLAPVETVRQRGVDEVRGIIHGLDLLCHEDSREIDGTPLTDERRQAIKTSLFAKADKLITPGDSNE